MKLRLTESELRLRVSRSDLDKLERENRIYSTLKLDDNCNFSFALQIATVDNLRTSFENGCLTIQIPRAAADQWIRSEQVGLKREENIRILVEKDFPCQHQPLADNRDTFSALAEKTRKEG